MKVLADILLLVHLLGLCLAFISALRTDFSIIQMFWKRSWCNKLNDLSHLKLSLMPIRVGFCLLFFSGGGLLIYYWHNSPDVLKNPKIWAKLCITLFTSLNGWFIDRFLTQVISQKRSFKNHTYLFTTCIVSLVSWIFLFLLGSFRSLNFKTSFMAFICGYLGILTVAISLALFIWKSTPYLLNKKSLHFSSEQ